MTYSEQANRLMNLVGKLETNYKQNRISFNNANKLVKKYHDDISKMANNARIKHANSQLAKMNLAVLKPNGSVNFPVRVWNRYLKKVEANIKKAINKPSSTNFRNAEKSMTSVINEQKKLNTGLKNLSKNIMTDCGKFELNKQTTAEGVRSAYRKMALKYHPNKTGVNSSAMMTELQRCRDRALKSLNNMKPNKPLALMPPKRPNNNRKPNKPLALMPPKRPNNNRKPNKPLALMPPKRPNNNRKPNKPLALMPPKNPVDTSSLKKRINSTPKMTNFRAGLRKTGNKAANRYKKNMGL